MMADQGIIQPVRIRPFPLKIGGWRDHPPARTVATAQRFAAQHLARYGRFFLHPGRLTMSWLALCPPLIINRRYETTVSDAGPQPGSRPEPSVYDQFFNLQTGGMAERPSLSHDLKFIMNNRGQTARRQTAVTSSPPFTWRKLEAGLEPQRIYERLHTRYETRLNRQERTLLVQRLRQQGRRIEAPAGPTAVPASPGASSPAPLPPTPWLNAPMTLPRRDPARRPEPSPREIRPLSAEECTTRNGRELEHQPLIQPAASPLSLDGPQWQQFADRVVRHIDDRILAQRERLGRF